MLYLIEKSNYDVGNQHNCLILCFAEVSCAHSLLPVPVSPLKHIFLIDKQLSRSLPFSPRDSELLLSSIVLSCCPTNKWSAYKHLNCRHCHCQHPPRWFEYLKLFINVKFCSLPDAFHDGLRVSHKCEYGSRAMGTMVRKENNDKFSILHLHVIGIHDPSAWVDTIQLPKPK